MERGLGVRNHRDIIVQSQSYREGLFQQSRDLFFPDSQSWHLFDLCQTLFASYGDSSSWMFLALFATFAHHSILVVTPVLMGFPSLGVLSFLPL